MLATHASTQAFPAPSKRLTSVSCAKNILLARESYSRPFSIEEHRRKLSLDLEFCCFSQGYTVACLSCPFPEDQRPELEDDTFATGGGRASEFSRLRLRQACACLGIDHKRLKLRSSDALTCKELETKFHKIAFSSHPDTALSSETADTKAFREAFSSYSLLRKYLKG